MHEDFEAKATANTRISQKKKKMLSKNARNHKIGKEINFFATFKTNQIDGIKSAYIYFLFSFHLI